MTAFTRILIVLAILRQALGTQQTPSNQIILGLSLFLTLFIMSPVIDIVWAQALTPYLDGDMEFQAALAAAQEPLREFMFSQTRDTDLAMFAELGGYPVFATRDEVPLFVLLPSFLTSELKNGLSNRVFVICALFSYRLVVAAVLNVDGNDDAFSNYYFFTFKLMLFVLIDGWSLISATLVSFARLGLD